MCLYRIHRHDCDLRRGGDRMSIRRRRGDDDDIRDHRHGGGSDDPHHPHHDGGSSDVLEKSLTPRGYRILSRVPRIPASIVAKIVSYFDENLQNILNADIATLDEVEGVGTVRSNAIHRSLIRQRDYAVFGAGKL